MKKRTVFVLIILVLAFVFTIAYAQRGNRPDTAASQNTAPPEQKAEVNKPADEPADTSQTREEPPDLSKLEMPILMYHHIREYNFEKDTIGTNLSVSPNNFQTQLDLIRSKGYETVTFDDLLGGRLPGKPIILTFDDGYKNFYENAYPELKRRNMKAVVFLIANSIGQSSYMSEQEIKEISDYGIEIGSHTLTHPNLEKLDRSRIESEIGDSKKNLEAKFNLDINSFCYPGGNYNSETAQIVKDAGYKFAATTKSGTANFSTSFELKRQRVNSDTNISGYLK